MTRRRPPLSIDAAIARVMDQLGGWQAVADVAGKTPRTCEKWGAFDIADPEDPDARDIPMRAAVKLDIAYQDAGGVGAPILEAYARLVDAAGIEAFGDKHELRRDSLDFLRETNEANIALLEAAEPGAGEAEIAIAQKQTLDVVQKGKSLLMKLAGRPRAPP